MTNLHNAVEQQLGVRLGVSQGKLTMSCALCSHWLLRYLELSSRVVLCVAAVLGTNALPAHRAEHGAFVHDGCLYECQEKLITNLQQLVER